MFAQRPSHWSNLVTLIKVSRPLVWAGYAGLAALGIAHTRVDLFSPRALALLAIFTFPCCFWIHGWNDLYDAESDRRNPRKDSWIHGGLIQPETERMVRIGLGVSVVIPTVAAFWFPLATTTSIFTVYLAAVIYSVPPIRIKERPILEGYWSAVTVCGVFVAGFCLGQPISRLKAELFLCVPAFVGFHFYYQSFDMQSDREAGHLTGAVRFGKKSTYLLATLFTLVSVISIPFGNHATPVQVGLIAQLVVFSATWLFPERLLPFPCILGLMALYVCCALFLLAHRFT